MSTDETANLDAVQFPARQPKAGPPGYLDLLKRQRWFIVVFVLSAAITALVQTYVYSEKFESYTAISYRAQEVTRFKALQNEAMGYPVPQAPFKVIGQTLQEVLRSDAVLADVVKALKLDEKRAAPTGTWYRVMYEQAKELLREYGGKAWMILKFGRIVEEDPTAKAIAELRDSIKLTNYDSYIFRLAVRDKQPDRAAQIADRLGQVLTAWLLEFDRQPGRSRGEQLGKLLEEKQRRLAAQRLAIEKLLDDNRIASIQIETERLTENLSVLRLEETRLMGDIARAQSRQASAEAKLAVKRRVLEASNDSPPVGEFIQPEDFKKLASQHLFEDVDLRGLLAKQAALKESIAGVSTRLLRLPAIQGSLDSMKLEVASIERDIALLSESLQEAAVRASSSVSEVRMLHPAVVPMAPVSPIKVYHVLLAAGLALLFSLGLVFALDFMGIRFLSAAADSDGRSVSESAPDSSVQAIPDDGHPAKAASRDGEST